MQYNLITCNEIFSLQNEVLSKHLYKLSMGRRYSVMLFQVFKSLLWLAIRKYFVLHADLSQIENFLSYLQGFGGQKIIIKSYCPF